MTGVPVEPDGRLAGYNGRGVFVAAVRVRRVPAPCDALEFLSSLSAGVDRTAWQRCLRPAFAAVEGGEYADGGERRAYLCWRHLLQLGDTGRLDIRACENAGR